MAEVYLFRSDMKTLEKLRDDLKSKAVNADPNQVNAIRDNLIGLYTLLKYQVEANQGDQKALLCKIERNLEQLRTEQAIHTEQLARYVAPPTQQHIVATRIRNGSSKLKRRSQVNPNGMKKRSPLCQESSRGIQKRKELARVRRKKRLSICTRRDQDPELTEAYVAAALLSLANN